MEFYGPLQLFYVHKLTSTQTLSSKKPRLPNKARLFMFIFILSIIVICLILLSFFFFSFLISPYSIASGKVTSLET